MTKDAVGLQAQELQRGRWRRWRSERGLASIEDERFALRGVPAVSESISARLVVLPSDTDAAPIEFSEDLRNSFKNPCPDPITGGETDFGRDIRSLSNCLALYEADYRDDSAPWKSYFALLRSGALDVTLSSDFGRAVDGARYFHLIGLVGRIWAAFARYSVFVRDHAIPGPYEVILALRDTKGAVLGGVAQGWLDPLRDGFRAGHLLRCVEPHLLWRDELDSWPVGQEQELAFRFGAWIEDAWGMKDRRFLAREGEYQGRVDPRPYR